MDEALMQRMEVERDEYHDALEEVLWFVNHPGTTTGEMAETRQEIRDLIRKVLEYDD